MKLVSPSPAAPAPPSVSGDWKPAEEVAVETGATGTEESPVREIGGRRDGTEPTRFGDWEKNGRCIDF